MQTAKNAAESVKEAASNVAASAKSGMEKTKATMQEKVINLFKELLQINAANISNELVFNLSYPL